MVEAVEIGENCREDVWKNRIYLIDVVDGAVKFARLPIDMNLIPRSSHGLLGPRRYTPPHLRLVRNEMQTVANHSDATDYVVLGITSIT